MPDLAKAQAREAARGQLMLARVCPCGEPIHPRSHSGLCPACFRRACCPVCGRWVKGKRKRKRWCRDCLAWWPAARRSLLALTAGECRSPHPLGGERLTKYAERAALRLPLFG